MLMNSELTAKQEINSKEEERVIVKFSFKKQFNCDIYDVNAQ